MIGANFDGASVMMGVRTGVRALLQRDFPAIIVIHCVAHKLELSVLDAAKSMPYLQKFEATMKSIFNFYHFPPKRRRELAEMADLVSTMLTNYSSVKAVRWVASKSRALVAVKKTLLQLLCTQRMLLVGHHRMLQLEERHSIFTRRSPLYVSSRCFILCLIY